MYIKLQLLCEMLRINPKSFSLSRIETFITVRVVGIDAPFTGHRIRRSCVNSILLYIDTKSLNYDDSRGTSSIPCARHKRRDAFRREDWFLKLWNRSIDSGDESKPARMIFEIFKRVLRAGCWKNRFAYEKRSIVSVCVFRLTILKYSRVEIFIDTIQF